ncbi:hypothetical protein AB1Y20_012704 [Prymnesium parvum]|uniref:Leucine-rich repeat domain-containing protein n=1 Tax=Prymnesium parvum TaxID=97485 RepID=A0AB34ILJ9_PRYPA
MLSRSTRLPIDSACNRMILYPVYNVDDPAALRLAASPLRSLRFTAEEAALSEAHRRATHRAPGAWRALARAWFAGAAPLALDLAALGIDVAAADALAAALPARGATILFRGDLATLVELCAALHHARVTLVAHSAAREEIWGDVRLPVGLHAIGDRAFEDCAELQSVAFPPGMQTIGDRAFAECTGLQSVTFENGLATIGDYAFERCTELHTVAFSSGLRTIGDHAFTECTALTSVAFPAGVEAIGARAFEDSEHS